jgi:hypothetical protein
MTADAATILAALHVSDRIKDYGSYAGFACVLGLAVLSLLYFAQAREVKRLREWAGRAPERDAELQARVTAEAQQRAATPAAAPAAAAAAGKPAAAAATPAGQAAAAKPATPAPTGAPATPGQQPAAKPGTPAPTPAGQPAAAPKPGVPAPATAAAAAAGAASASPPSAKPDAAKSGDGATPTPSTPAPATPAGASPSNGAVDQPTQITPAPASASATPKPAPKPGQPLRPPPAAPAAEDDHEHSPLRATLMIVGGVVAAIVVVVVLVLTVFSGGNDKKSPNTIGNAPATTPAGSTSGKPSSGKTAPISRGDVTVAVLNGTTVPGLARGAGNKLQNAGFKLGTVTNAPDQARSATIVAYQAGHQNEARVVARIIGVGADAIKPIDQSTAVVAGQDAFVVVTVGADQSQ